jgi:type I restriction enzyme S subunit
MARSSLEQYPIEDSEIPKTWARAFVGQVIRDIRSGFSSGQHSTQPPGAVHLRPMNIGRDGKLTLEDVRYIPDTGGVRVRDGDALFNNTNSRELVGKTAPISGEETFGFSNHMTRLRPPAGVSSRFVALQLHYLWRSGYFRHRSTQHVNQASISTGTLARSVPFLLPPSSEQKRIVDEVERQFSRLDAADVEFLAAATKLDRYRLSVLSAACSGKLVKTEAALAKEIGRKYESAAKLVKRIGSDRAAKAEEQGLLWEPAKPNGDEYKEVREALPTGWVWAKVKDIGELRLGRQRSPEHHLGKNMRPYLRVANVFEDRIDVSDVLEMNFTPEEFELFELRWGDILLNEGQSLNWLGEPRCSKRRSLGLVFRIR